MSTIRAYSNGKRVSTAKPWNNQFLQVYPEIRTFMNEEEWRSAWSTALTQSIRFVLEGEEEAGYKVFRPPPLSIPPISMPEELFTTPPPLSRHVPSTKGWSFRDELTFTAPPGTYYIGDLCYALFDNVYDTVFGGKGYSAGFYSKGKSFFMVDGTACGDGQYVGTDNHEYLVDAGIIGICSSDLIDPSNRSANGGKIHTFTEPVEVRFKGGVFHFNSGYTYIKIDTAGEEE